MRYSVMIYYDAMDDIYVASVPELEGCIAHGTTQEEAIKEIQLACEMWLDAARENGTAIPEPSHQKIAI